MSETRGISNRNSPSPASNSLQLRASNVMTRSAPSAGKVKLWQLPGPPLPLHIREKVTSIPAFPETLTPRLWTSFRKPFTSVSRSRMFLS